MVQNFRKREPNECLLYRFRNVGKIGFKKEMVQASHVLLFVVRQAHYERISTEVPQKI
jgi:hypothetical protein